MSTKIWINCGYAIALVLISVVAISCQNTKKDSRSEVYNNTEHAVSTVVEVDEGFMKDELVLNGVVTCDESKVSKVYIPCSGRVQDVSAEIGDCVNKGQLLASVFSQDAADFEKEMSGVKGEIRLAERELLMKKELHRNGMVSDKDVLEAQVRLDLAKAEEDRLLSVGSVIGFASKSHASISSPITGYIVAKNIYNGSYIDSANNGTPAFEIADLNSVWITADVYESDICRITQGEKVSISILAYPDEMIEGSIDKVYKRLDDESKTMKVRVRIANSNNRFLPGMFANVHVVLHNSSRLMLRVPAESVVFENGKNYVVAVDINGKCHRQEVCVAHQDGQFAYLRDGVKKNDKIVGKNAILEYNALKY